MSTTFPVIKGVLLSSKHYTWNTADSLGRGASAIVYLGRHRDTGRVVAVKSFHKHLPSSRNVDLRELELLRQLHHENIIRLLDIQYEEDSRQPVLVMEYCEGGSLHHMLELPAYYYGLSETEYILVLTHVADGMAYLRNENIIHRDIKPGNIMRFITDEGSSVYKLTDFGAARNLDDEEQFESLYGTEEYLHPGVYERAVLRHPTGRSFDARVDLWSLGVTFYHAATGKLPFQPYGGRSNKEIMFQIISKKESGVISGVQKKENGPIEWKRELPESCPLSNGLRSVVTPLLSGLMEPDQSKMISYETLFSMVNSLQNKITINIFHFVYGQEMTIYADKTSLYSDVQDMIASQLDISASDQILLVGGKPMDEVVDPVLPVCEYPAEILEDSIFLFQTSSREEFRLKDPEIYPFPDVSTYSGMEMDSRHANLCCAQGELISRYAKTVSKRQDLLLKGLICLRLYVESRHSASRARLELMQQLMLEFELRLDSFFGMVKFVMSIIPHQCLKDRDRETLKGIEEEKVIRPVFMKAKERVSEIERYRHSLTDRLDTTKQSASKLVSQCKKDKCCQKIAHHLTVVSGIQSRFRRDKNVRHQMTSHDENIHHFERQKLHKHCMSLKSVLGSHCFIQQAKLFHDALKVVDFLTRNLNHVNKIEVNMTSVISCQKLLSDKVVKMNQSCNNLFAGDSGLGQSVLSENSLSSMQSMSLQTRSLENKLMDLQQQLEMNSGILNSLEDGSLSLGSRMGATSIEQLVSNATGEWTDPG